MANSKENTKRVVVVLSAGRSGTSLLMQALGALGMNLSDNLLGPHFENPDGFFEDIDIVALQKQLLADLRAKPMLPLPDGWRDADAVMPYRAKIRSLIEDRLAKVDKIWGFKDPRTCSLLPLWIEIFRSMWIIPSFVLAVREPSAAVRSIIKQAKLSGEMAELVWLFRTCDALINTAADCCIVHYEDWFSRPVQTADDLLHHTGLDRHFHGDVEKSLGGIIKPNLNRAIHEEYRIKNPYVLQLYDALQECKGSEFDRGRLMNVVKECRAAMDNFKGWYMEAQKVTSLPDTGDPQAKKRLERRLAEIDQLTLAVRELTIERDALRTQVKLNAEREAKYSELQMQTQTIFENKINTLLADLEILTLQNNAFLKQVKELHEKSEGLAIRVHTLSQPAKVNVQPMNKRMATKKGNQGKAEKKARTIHHESTKVKNALDLQHMESSRRTKLWRKLKNDPHRFFSDSQITFIRPLKHLFKSRF